MALRLPRQGSIDRSVPLSGFMLTTAITDDTGKVIEKLVSPVGGSFGMLPTDPAAWSPANGGPRTAVCQILSARGAAQCLRSRGYF
jgi:hypothetical protein